MAEREDEFDVVVIGGGPAGEVAAQYAVRDSGLTCALVESELLGGECSYWACMPSKALLRPLEVAGAARNLGGLAGVRVDGSGLLDRRDTWRSDLDDAGQVDWAEGVGLTVVRGRGRLVGERLVDVESDGGTRRLRARQAVVLATGSAPNVPDALTGVAPWTSRDATGVLEVPGRLAILGGGVVACEAATWMAGLGSEVTVLVRGERLLSSFEPFAGDAVADGLRAAGVDVRFGVTVSDAVRDRAVDSPETGRLHGGPVRLAVGDATLEVDEVLAATGRRPNLSDVGLASVGLTPDDLTGALEVRDGWLYAVGDAGGGPKLTHWGKYQGRQVGGMIAAKASRGGAPSAEEIARDGRASTSAEELARDERASTSAEELARDERASRSPVPQVVFSQPQVASVGLTLAEARAAGRDVRAVDRPLTDAAGVRLLRDDASGHVRLVLEGDRIVGATFVGTEVAELLHAATVAIVGGVPLAALVHAVPAYPTASEIWLSVVDAALRG